MLSLTVTVLRLGCGVQVFHMAPDSPAGSHVAVEWLHQLCYPLPPLRAWGQGAVTHQYGHLYSGSGAGSNCCQDHQQPLAICSQMGLFLLG